MTKGRVSRVGPDPITPSPGAPRLDLVASAVDLRPETGELSREATRGGRCVSGKAANLALITAAQVLALSLWFSGTAAGPGMVREAAGAVGAGFQSWLTG